MRSSTRALLVTILLATLVAFGAAYLLWALDQQEAQRRVLVVFGAAIGGVGGAGIFLAALLRLRGR